MWRWVLVLCLCIFTTIITFDFYSTSLPSAIWAFIANVHSSNQSLKYIKPHQKKIIHSLHDILMLRERDWESERESLSSISKNLSILETVKARKEREREAERQKRRKANLTENVRSDLVAKSWLLWLTARDFYLKLKRLGLVWKEHRIWNSINVLALPLIPVRPQETRPFPLALRSLSYAMWKLDQILSLGLCNIRRL